jgi:DNA-binding LacI/PurR family transcriptional regulator
MTPYRMDTSALRGRVKVDDVIRFSGVSRSSVFRYFGGKRLRPAIREAIETALDRAGYTVPGNPQKAPRFEIVVSVSSALGSFRGYAEIVEGIMARASEAGIGVRLSTGEGGRAGDTASELRTAVVILGKSIAQEEAEIRELRARGLPFVLVNRRIEELDGTPLSYVSADFRAAAATSVGNLLDSGRRRVAVWDDGSEEYRVAREKLEGWRSAYAARGLRLPDGLLTRRSEESLESAVDRLLGGGAGSAGRPDAWFAMDDEAALRVIRGARGFGIASPADLALASVNDSEAARLSQPSVTSARIPFFEAGRSSVDVLARLLERPIESSIRMLLGHSLIIRETSGGREGEGS